MSICLKVINLRVFSCTCSCFDMCVKANLKKLGLKAKKIEDLCNWSEKEQLLVDQ